MDKSDKFFCETHKCTITVSGCLLRQERNNEKKQPPAWMFNKIPGDPRCANCKQGKQIKKGNYQPIKEEFMDVKTELNELEAAVKKRGPGRPPKTSATPQPEASKICKACETQYTGKRVEENFYKSDRTDDGYEGTCKKCKVERAKELRHARKAGKASARKPKVKPAQAPKKKVIQVDFTNYPELYEDLEETATREFRTPELQILALLAAL